jgi:hypothetical protein
LWQEGANFGAFVAIIEALCVARLTAFEEGSAPLLWRGLTESDVHRQSVLRENRNMALGDTEEMNVVFSHDERFEA